MLSWSPTWQSWKRLELVETSKPEVWRKIGRCAKCGNMPPIARKTISSRRDRKRAYDSLGEDFRTIINIKEPRQIGVSRKPDLWYLITISRDCMQRVSQIYTKLRVLSLISLHMSIWTPYFQSCTPYPIVSFIGQFFGITYLSNTVL